MASQLQNPTISDVYSLLLDLQSDVKSLKDDINKVNTKIDNINISLSDVESGTSKLEEDYFELEATVKNLTSHVNETSLSLSTDYEKVNKTLTDHDKLLKPKYDPENTIGEYTSFLQTEYQEGQKIGINN